MKILNCRPALAGGNTVAHVDVEIIDGVKLFGLRVMRMADGTPRVFGEKCSFDRAIVASIAEAISGGDRLEPSCS